MSKVRLKRGIVNEQSGCYVAAEFYDRDGALVIPDSVRYRIDCLTTQGAVADWAALTPSTSVDILVTAAQNAIRDSRNREETKQVTVEATQDGVTWRETATYVVRNLDGTT